MIDEGETDWKLVCIDRNDPLAGELNDIGYVITLVRLIMNMTG